MTSKILLNIPRLCLRGILHPVINTAGPVCSCRHLTSDVASQQNVIQNIFTRKEKDEHSKIIFRTDVTNPGDHEIRHEGLLYTIDRGIFRRISSDDCFNRFKIQVRTFQEACIMIRKPALEVIHAMKNFDPNLPMPKFILYGHLGTPWPQQWIERYTEVSKSTHKPGRIDLPMEARAFLCQLKSQNGIVLNDYKTQYRYDWTEREATEIGTPLIELLKFGLQRVKFADDVVGALLKEIKLLASQRKMKVLVVADGINGFFGPTGNENFR
ncbi:DAP3 [Mytilus edulis]|uniref:Small ribosomal subunit protein mS29 n=1 Tax=Mytilus edulis TaxID=6550 RepID=A0A8S3SQE5_MYTED|nr:DAP3 [Mytilus edulis]